LRAILYGATIFITHILMMRPESGNENDFVPPTHGCRRETKEVSAMVYVLLALGFLFVLWGSVWLVRQVVASLFWPRAEGTVVGLVDGIETGDLHPRVSFYTPAGKKMEFVSPDVISYAPGWKIGRRVRVIYLSDRPEQARILDWSAFVTPLFVLVFGILLIWGGLYEQQHPVAGQSNVATRLALRPFLPSWPPSCRLASPSRRSSPENIFCPRRAADVLSLIFHPVGAKFLSFRLR
jgi:hypothetical protein